MGDHLAAASAASKAAALARTRMSPIIGLEADAAAVGTAFELSGRDFEEAGAQRMSRPLIVSIPHALGKEEALRRLKAGMERIITHVPVMEVNEQSWAGDRMTFRASALGQTAVGTIDVSESDVRLELSLPWMLQAFRRLRLPTFGDAT